MLGIEVQLLVNIYRISRITGWGISVAANLIYGLIFIVFILCTVVFIILNRGYFSISKLKVKLITVLLWIPYFFIINYVFSHFLKMENGGDFPTPIIGLMSIVLFIIHFIYVLLLNLFSKKNNSIDV